MESFRVGVAPAPMGYAKTYIQIVGGTCFLNSLTPIYSSYLRAFGHTKEPMQATIAANIVNLVLNAIFLFGFKMCKLCKTNCRFILR